MSAPAVNPLRSDNPKSAPHDVSGRPSFQGPAKEAR